LALEDLERSGRLICRPDLARFDIRKHHVMCGSDRNSVEGER
jgi:hypothetical protein